MAPNHVANVMHCAIVLPSHLLCLPFSPFGDQVPVLGLRSLEPDVVRGAAQRALHPAEKSALLLTNLGTHFENKGRKK